MTTFATLIERLESLPPDDWESIWSATSVQFTREEQNAALAKAERCREWVRLRLDAGTPGTTLPDPMEALQEVLQAQGGAAEAYAAVFHAAPLPPDGPVLPLLVNAAGCCLQDGYGQLAGWLVMRAAFASLVLGDLKRAWLYQTLPTQGGRRHPALYLMQIIEPIQAHPELVSSPLLRLALCFFWPALSVPAVPMLPFPTEPPEQELGALLEALQAVGAMDLAEMIAGVFAELQDATANQVVEGEPVIDELRRRALSGEPPPEVDVLPPEFSNMALALVSREEYEAARLAGLMLHAHGEARAIVSRLVWRVARATDLDAILPAFEGTEIAAALAELQQCCAELPEPLADALVAVSLPRHLKVADKIEVLNRNQESLAGLSPAPSGLVARALDMVRQIHADRTSEHAQARPAAHAIQTAVEQAVAMLSANPTQADIERVVRDMVLPEVTHSLMEMTTEAALLNPERLVQSLALLRAIEGTPHAQAWEHELLYMASNAIFRMGNRNLFGLRLTILDRLVQTSSSIRTPAEAFVQRANTRRVLAGTDEGKLRDVLSDLDQATDVAMRSGELDVLADAAAMAAKVGSELLAIQHPDAPDRELLVARIASVLLLPVTDERRAALLQGLAHLQRFKDPHQAAHTFGEAVALLAADDPFRWEVHAEQVAELARIGQHERAVKEARALLNQVTEQATDTVIGMVHVSTGDALAAAGSLQEACQQFEAALERVRGVDQRNTSAARIRLMTLAIQLDDKALFQQHHAAMQRRWDTLRTVERRDVTKLVGRAASVGMVDHGAAEELMGQPSQDGGVLALERARLALDGGQLFDANGTIRAALRDTSAPEVRALISEIASNHGGALQSEVLEQILVHTETWGMPGVEARLLEHLKRIPEAIKRLRAALSEELNPLERLACTHMLMAMLGDGNRVERLALCTQLAAQLEEVADRPEIRIDLAQAYRLLADGDRSLLEQSWQHAQRALPGLRSPREREQGHRVLAMLVQDFSLVARGESVVRERARWLLDPHPLPPNELAGLQHAVAHNLVILGPVCHPEALGISEALVQKVLATVSGPGSAQLVAERCRWIRAIQSGTKTDAMPGINGPADGFPDWVVGLVAERKVKVPKGALKDGIDSVMLASELRPDCADRLFAYMVRRLGYLDQKARGQLLRRIYNVVMGPNRGEGAWAELERAIAGVKRNNHHPTLRSIRDELKRSQTGTVVPPPKRAPTIKRKGSTEEAEQSWQRGVELMRTVHAEPYNDQNAKRIREARRLLQRAVDIAKRRKMDSYEDFLISLGNSWKMPPDENVEKALQIYERVARRDLHPQRRAKLQKVQGDALRHRGKPEDLRQAIKLLEKSARARRGWERSESLNNAASVAAEHPDWSELERARRAAELLLESAQADARHAADALPNTLRYLAEWEALEPDAPRIKAIRAELETIYPGQRDLIRRPAPRPSPKLREFILETMEHPAGSVVASVTGRLMSPEQIRRDPMGMKQRLGQAAEIEAHLLERSVWRNAAGIRGVLAELDETTEEEKQPGVRVGQAMLLAELCRLGEVPLSDVVVASKVAQEGLNGTLPTAVQSMLLCALARLWAPRDHMDDPVRDFALTTALAAEAVSLEGGEAEASVDALELLARGRRYTGEGDIGENLREAERLYGVLLERAVAEGHPELAANAEHCLADVRSQQGRGDRHARLIDGAQQLEKALAGTLSPYRKAEFTSSLAWQRTRIAHREEGVARQQALSEALTLFDTVDVAMLEGDPGGRDHYLNRTVCEGALAKVTGGRLAEVDVWRRYLEETDNIAPYNRATAQHNLANALLVGANISIQELAEGLRLCKKAAVVRTIKANPRHHWETTLLAGGALASALHRTGGQGLPWEPQLAWTKARKWLKKAVRAATILGPGEELADAAFALTQLAWTAPSTRDALSVAEESWIAMQEAAPYLLLHRQSAAQESEGALHLALTLTYRIARQRIRSPLPDGGFALDGEEARIVLRWCVRGLAVLRRGLQARLGRPSGVGLQDWLDWLAVLNEADPVRMVEQLNTLRSQASEFLSGEPALEGTWRWLKGRPGSVGIFVLLATPISIAVLLQLDERGQQQVHVLGLPATPCPVEEAELHRAMLAISSAADVAAQLHEQAVAWVKEQLISPILRFLGKRPTAVLWCPGQVLRHLSPKSLWPGIPVAMTTSLVLPDLRAAAQRPCSTLVVLADPGEGRQSLVGKGQQAARQLAIAAQQRGPVQVLASVGTDQGAAVSDLEPIIPLDRASASAVLEHSRDHDVVVVIAHGEAPSPEAAALLLLDESGQIERLGVQELGHRPRRIAGATVILLACESGRIGTDFHAPGGIAGALVTAGVKTVVAPLWPVRLDAAQRVAEAVLTGLASGRAPWEAVAGAHDGAKPTGPVLGPAASLGTQRAEVGLQQIAFVTWVG